LYIGCRHKIPNENNFYEITSYKIKPSWYIASLNEIFPIMIKLWLELGMLQTVRMCAKTKMLEFYGFLLYFLVKVIIGLLSLCPLVMVLALTLGDSPYDVDLALREYLSLLDYIFGDD